MFYYYRVLVVGDPVLTLWRNLSMWSFLVSKLYHNHYRYCLFMYVININLVVIFVIAVYNLTDLTWLNLTKGYRKGSLYNSHSFPFIEMCESCQRNTLFVFFYWWCNKTLICNLCNDQWICKFSLVVDQQIISYKLIASFIFVTDNKQQGREAEVPNIHKLIARANCRMW